MGSVANVLSVNSVKPAQLVLLKLTKVRLSTKIMSLGFSNEVIMGRWSDSKVGIGRQAMLYIYQKTASDGNILRAITGAHNSGGVIANRLSVPPAPFPYDRLTGRRAKDRSAH